MKKLLSAVWLFALIAAMSACEIRLGETERTVEEVALLEGSASDVYTIEGFDIESLRMEILYSDASREVKPLETGMLTSASLTLLEEAGEHTLTAAYEGVEFSFGVRLVEEMRDVFLYRLYSLGVEDALLEESYENWKESLRGEDGVSVVDAEIVDGKLTLTLSDDRTLTAGMVKGSDGREIELRVQEALIEWRYEDEDDWNVLMDKANLKGESGREIELRSEEALIEWRYEGEAWQPLLDVSDLTLSEVFVEDVSLSEGELNVFFSDGSVKSFLVGSQKHVVAFVDFEGRLISLNSVETGQSVAKPQAPELEGYSFVSWSETTGSIEEDMVVVAEYEANTYTVSYQTNITETLSDATYAYGETIEHPVLEKEGLFFAGWYVDASYSRLFNNETMPARNVTLYARFFEIDGEAVERPPAIEDILDVYRKSVIGVEVTREDNGGRGSAVVYKYDNGYYYAFTNHHVVNEHETISIVYEHYGNVFTVGEEDLELLGKDARTDMALLRFEAPHDFEPFLFADSYEARIGERVYAIGSPLGFDYYGSVTTGIVSNLNRFMTLDETNAFFIQHDAAINPGNSGGALINAKGEILGMNTLKMVGEDIEGMGYALPANTIVRILADLESEGVVTRGLLGITMQHIEHCDFDYGVCLESVQADKTADLLGLEAGDVIIGYKIEGMDGYWNVYNQLELRQFVMNTRALEDISVRYVRGGDVVETGYSPLQVHPDDE